MAAWWDDMFGKVDAGDLRGFVAHLSEDAAVTFGNGERSTGTPAILEMLAAYLGAISSIDHDWRHAYVDGDVTVLEGSVTFLRRDGHSVDIPLEAIAAHAQRGMRYRLQLVPSTTVYYPQKIAGQLNVRQARITLPIASTG